MNIETNLKKTYKLIKRTAPQVEVDSLEVIKKIEEHRRFWKPKDTKVVLLAESHVYTDQEDFEIEIDRSFLQTLPQGYPSRFVRFVYCLGYGENRILTKKPRRMNTGTPQYWKIFSSCVARDKHNLGFEKIKKTGTKQLNVRLRNKLNILEKMKSRGIWLLDASIVGLYGNQAKRNPEAYQKILEICWDNYIKGVIKEANPKFIIVIGKQVGSILYSRLTNLEISFETLYQPQARISAEERLKNFQRFNERCTSIIKGEKDKPPKPISESSPIPPTPFKGATEKNLPKLGYAKTSRSEWQKQDRIIHVLKSKEHGPYIRITWREEWRDDQAIIYEYSKVNGPICIVPIPELFNTDFVREKRQQPSYENSGYWWTQRFPLDKPLAQFVLGYKDRWDLL